MSTEGMTPFTVGIFSLYENLLGRGQVVDFYFLTDVLNIQGSAEVFALRFLCQVTLQGRRCDSFLSHSSQRALKPPGVRNGTVVQRHRQLSPPYTYQAELFFPAVSQDWASL